MALPDQIITQGKSILNQYTYGQVRTPDGSLDFTDSVMDCSEFVLYCVKAASPSLYNQLTVATASDRGGNTDTIKQGIMTIMGWNDLSGLGQDSPGAGDWILWNDHIEIIQSTTDSGGYVTLGANGSDKVPKNITCRNFDSVKKIASNFQGIWTPQAPSSELIAEQKELLRAETAPPWKPIVGLAFATETFKTYCQSVLWTTWRPQFIVLHNTFIPKLADKPMGFSGADMQGFVHYYRDQMQWSAGPHLFVDDKQIWVFTPINTPGIHSPSWNNISLGVEMLGNYDQEDFTTGRGLNVHRNAVSAVRTLSETLGIDPNTMRLHKEDPSTTHKNCPGKTVDKATFIREVIAAAILGERLDHLPEKRI